MVHLIICAIFISDCPSVAVIGYPLKSKKSQRGSKDWEGPKYALKVTGTLSLGVTGCSRQGQVQEFVP